MILKNHTSAPIRKERLSPTSKARREASRNEFVEKGGMPDRVKGFREINSRQDRPRARPGFVKPIRNGLRKVQNLTKCRPSRAETGLAGRKNGIRFQKKKRRDSMMRSNSFDTQEVRDRPEGSRRVERFSHLMYGNNRRCLPDGMKRM